jgi:hypothetical protein
MGQRISVDATVQEKRLLEIRAGGRMQSPMESGGKPHALQNAGAISKCPEKFR